MTTREPAGAARRPGRRPTWSRAPRPGASPPTHGVLRDREWRRAGSTVQVAAGRRPPGRPALPRRSVPPGRCQSRAGAQLIRSISVGSVISPLHQFAKRERERRLQADDPVGRVVELALLGVVVVRRVIGGDAVERAVGERRADRIAILRLAQRRVHLGVGVVSLAPLVGQR